MMRFERTIASKAILAVTRPSIQASDSTSTPAAAAAAAAAAADGNRVVVWP